MNKNKDLLFGKNILFIAQLFCLFKETNLIINEEVWNLLHNIFLKRRRALESTNSFCRTATQNKIQYISQGGYLAVYYTSPQSFITSFSYSLA